MARIWRTDWRHGLADLHGRIQSWGLSSQTVTKSLDRQSRWPETSIGHCGAGGQGRPARRWCQVLNQIWEEDFLGFHYGFRPGRSQHDALDALYVGITSKKVNYVVDLDIRSFFDQVGHDHLEKFVRHRIGDERVVRLILKWLKAGVIEDGQWFETEEGTPQGAVMTA